jgi:hypothetical protein
MVELQSLAVQDALRRLANKNYWRAFDALQRASAEACDDDPRAPELRALIAQLEPAYEIYRKVARRLVDMFPEEARAAREAEWLGLP